MYKLQFSSIDSVNAICAWQQDCDPTEGKSYQTKLVRTTMLVDNDLVISTVEWVIIMPDGQVKTVPPSGAFANRNCRILMETEITLNEPFVISDLEMHKDEEMVNGLPIVTFAPKAQENQDAIFDGHQIRLI